ncbi:MAG: hypothetical protein HMLKMBBP_01933 [Planctomycetes bacterium]|nr:hypothetical protein [Planctomycetota bacterium]
MTANPLVRVRRAVPADAAQIAAFNGALALESEDHRLDPETVLRGVRALLEDASKGFYVVAESAGRLVGQSLVTYEWSDWRNGMMWWFGSVYVDPQFRGYGVFKSIHDRIVDEARAAGVVQLRLYVWKTNDRAKTTYSRLGWTDAGYDVLEREP